MMATLEMEPGAEWAWLWAWLCPWCSTSCWEMITVSLEQHRRESGVTSRQTLCWPSRACDLLSVAPLSAMVVAVLLGIMPARSGSSSLAQ